MYTKSLTHTIVKPQRRKEKERKKGEGEEGEREKEREKAREGKREKERYSRRRGRRRERGKLQVYKLLLTIFTTPTLIIINQLYHHYTSMVSFLYPQAKHKISLYFM